LLKIKIDEDGSKLENKLFIMFIYLNKLKMRDSESNLRV
jgi:hypothetical protein